MNARLAIIKDPRVAEILQNISNRNEAATYSWIGKEVLFLKAWYRVSKTQTRNTVSVFFFLQ